MRHSRRYHPREPTRLMAETPTPIAEIEHGPSKFEQFLDNHQSKIIIAAILLSLGLLGYVVWSGLDQAEQHEAGSALIKADEIPDYQDIIKKYPDSATAASALPLLANMQWQDSQPEAIETLQDFLNQNPEHPTAHTARVSLGLRLLQQGKTEEAKEQLSQIAENHPDSYIAPLACIALGDIAKSQSEVEEAKNWYEKARGDGDRTSSFLDMANQRLRIVNAEPPTKIEPAPPAPPAPPAADTPAAPETEDKEPLPAPELNEPDAPNGGTPEKDSDEPQPDAGEKTDD